MAPEKGDIWAYFYPGFPKAERYLFLDFIKQVGDQEHWCILCLDDGRRTVGYFSHDLTCYWKKVA